MTLLELVLASILALLLLWIAYKIGKLVLRLCAGLLVLGAAAYLLWHFVLR